MSADPRLYVPYDVPMTGGGRARLLLPLDLSAAEAGRLCDVIWALAFTDGEIALPAAEKDELFAARHEAVLSLAGLMACRDAADGTVTRSPADSTAQED